MERSNRPITSREYKLMLNVDRFQDRESGSEAFWDLVGYLVEKQEGNVKKKIEEIERRTWYLDTDGFELRRHGFILRIREETSEDRYKVTLKYRDSDRYISANLNMSPPDDLDVARSKKDEVKFEEDIIPPFVSKFANSISIRPKTLPTFEDMNSVMEYFPIVKSLKVAGSTPFNVVNNFKACEVARRIGKIHFGKKTHVKACLSFWYYSKKKSELPLVVEFSFDCDARKEMREIQDMLEYFPVEVVEKTNRFFRTIQKQTNWLSLNGTTKTAYAYGGF